MSSAKSAITIRPLRRSEWSAFKDCRLVALKSAPGMFSTSYEDALARSPVAWQEIITGQNHQVFGLFDGTQMIGITGVFGDREYSEAGTAHLVMSFIIPEYRNHAAAPPSPAMNSRRRIHPSRTAPPT